MAMKLFDWFCSLWNQLLIYFHVFVSLSSPGTVIWNRFGNRQGKVRLLNRDLICDYWTLKSLPRSLKPLDQFTNALEPFLALFLIEDEQLWKERRDVFTFAINEIEERMKNISIDFRLEEGKGNYLWILFQMLFRYSFQLIFLRPISEKEFEEIYPGLLDINQMIKRFRSRPQIDQRQRFYRSILQLISLNEKDFLFHSNDQFHRLDQLNQVSSVAEDLLITISVQCTDLIAHLLLLYSSYPDEFHFNFDLSLNETLRLFPLTDLWIRQDICEEKSINWIASLVQLNRNGWKNANEFDPQRWKEKNERNPPLLSWGFDQRRCPAQRLATKISKLFFEKLIEDKEFWIEPAKNFVHERTFPYGLQIAIGYGIPPKDIKEWKFQKNMTMIFRRWICEKLRMFDQKELN